MTTITFYKCPLCNMSQYSGTFLKYGFGNKQSLDLGYLQVRLCKGRKGLPRISYEPLSSVCEEGIGKEILDKLIHQTSAVIHALHKQGLIADSDLPTTEIAKKLEKHKDLIVDSEHKKEELKEHYEVIIIKANEEIAALKTKLDKYRKAVSKILSKKDRDYHNYYAEEETEYTEEEEETTPTKRDLTEKEVDDLYRNF